MAKKETINGYNIISEHRLPRQEGKLPARIILGASDGAQFSPFVTALVADDSGWIGGHYCKTSAEAVADFTARIKKAGI